MLITLIVHSVNIMFSYVAKRSVNSVSRLTVHIGEVTVVRVPI